MKGCVGRVLDAGRWKGCVGRVLDAGRCINEGLCWQGTGC